MANYRRSLFYVYQFPESVLHTRYLGSRAHSAMRDTRMREAINSRKAQTFVYAKKQKITRLIFIIVTKSLT